MSDGEILEYLTKHNFEVNAQDCIMDIFNTSFQIKKKIFDAQNMIMKIITDENEFIFTWKVNKLS